LLFFDLRIGLLNRVLELIIVGLTGALWSFGFISVNKYSEEIDNKNDSEIINKTFQKKVVNNFLLGIIFFIGFLSVIYFGIPFIIRLALNN
jgi:hypothetical protein